MGWGNPVVGGTTLVRAAIQSANYSPSPLAGWTINQNGTATFADLVLYGGETFIYSGTPAAGDLIYSISNGAVSDGLGNTTPGPGATSYENVSGTYYAISHAGGGLIWWTATNPAGPWTRISQIGNGFLGAIPKPLLDLINFTGLLLGTGAPLNSMVIICPSGDSSGATDTANINDALAAGFPVQLLPTGAWNVSPYYISAPLLIPTQGHLWGWQRSHSSANDNYSAGAGLSTGTVIVMAAGFTGSAAIELVNSAGGVQNSGVDLRDFTVEGFELSSGTIYGMLVQGAWGACHMSGVMIHRPPSDCFHFITDPTTGKIPDEWTITDCKASASRTGYGFYLAELADSNLTGCNASENANDNWYVNYGVNTRFINCKAENGAAFGFHLAGLAAGQTQYLVGCSTHLNSESGFQFDNAGPSGGGLGTYLLTGCVAQQDGQNLSGSAAGFRVAGCKSRVVLTGCSVDLNASGPAFGASQVSASYYTQGTGSWFQGNSAATNDDASNTWPLLNAQPVAH